MSQYAILQTKLYIPPIRPELVSRPRLIERLNAGLHRKLTLVSAPAGFGKTTLISEWVRHSDRPAGWLSLDEHDNDLTRFLTYLIGAMQHIDKEIGVDVQAALGESQSPQFETLLTKLVKGFEVIQDKSILVLDDYHLIGSKSVHDALNFLIEYLPPTMHIVIIGRTDPPIPISRLRVQGDMIEIRTPDLRFSKTEVAALLNNLMGFTLPSKDIAALEERTEGWIASLYLAALSMQGRDDWREFIITFSGSHRYVIDYLMDEVMDRQPEKVRTFLRHTSILDQFCAPLCNAVVSGEGIEEKGIIDYLERSNLFSISLDDHREWYRYHHLFADFLKQRLHEKEPEHIPELHRRASQWYEAEGFVDKAIQHAQAAGDLENAIRLVEQIAADLISRRESNKLLKYVEQLPADRFQDYPILCVFYAFALLFSGQLEAAEPILGIAEANRDKAPRIPIPGYAATVRAFVANQMGDNHKAVNLAEQALEEMLDALPDRVTLFFRGAAVIWLGVNYRKLGDLEKARELFVKAASLNEAAGNIYAVLAAMHQLADLTVIQGQLRQAVVICQQGFQMARRWTDGQGERLRTLVAAGGLHLRLGTVLYQWNDLAGATPHIQRAVDVLELGEALGRLYAYRMLAYLKQAQGDYEACYELLVKTFAIKDKISVIQANISTLPSLEQLGIMLSQLHPDMAHLFTDIALRVEALGKQPDDDIDFTSPSGYSQELDYSNLVRVLIAQDRASEALPLLVRLLEAARSMGRTGDEIRYSVLIALAHHALEDMPSALDFFREASTLAEPQSYVRIFVDEGYPMAELLVLSISHGIAPDYASELLAAFPKDVRQSVDFDSELKTSTQPLVEPLSERELDVLQLLVAGYKYKEIAERLFISVNTVRHHTRNVYSKLNANNRAQAIARAKEVNLL